MAVTARRLGRAMAAACAIAVARAWLRIAPGGAVRWASGRASRHEKPTARTPSRGDEIARAVAGAAARLPWQASCLEQGIALVLLLAIVRHPARLVVGVIREDASIRAHAWVESDGRVVLGAAGEQAFAPLPLSRAC